MEKQIVIVPGGAVFPNKFTVVWASKMGEDGRVAEGRHLAYIEKPMFLSPEDEEAFKTFLSMHTVVPW